MFLRATRLWREGTRDPIRSASLLILAISSIAFAVWLVSLARREWFVYDEFDYLQPAGEPLVTWLLRPHNEHTITFTKAWFGSLSSTLGLRGYGLYIGPLIVSHLVAVWLIYRLTWISTTSRILANGIALVALTMGAAAGTLTWAGQLQYTGSVAAGLGAILLACQRPGRRETVVLVATTIFETLNGTAFLAFGLAAATMYVARRRWLEATIAGQVACVSPSSGARPSPVAHRRDRSLAQLLASAAHQDVGDRTSMPLGSGWVSRPTRPPYNVP
jgi:hypothetical protein